MNMNDVYDKLFGCGAPLPEATPWEPDIDKSIPEPVYSAMVRTAHIDQEREIEARNRKYIHEQVQRHMMMSGNGLADAHRYGSGLSQGTGATSIGDAQMLENERLRGLVNSSSMTPNLWNQKALEQCGQSLFGQPIEEKKMGSDDTYIEDGIMRIKFPFGEVEMNVSNEAELDRAYEMAKHMLKVHEENKATHAIKKNLRETPLNVEVEAQVQGVVGNRP